jgi:hypothetical protein
MTRGPRPDKGKEETMSWIRSRSGIVFLVFLGIVGFFLVTEHTAHVFGALPFLLLLACPLMHFLHRGHGHARGGDPGRGHGRDGAHEPAGRSGAAPRPDEQRR